VDLFGRRRRSIEAAQASYQASAADLENVRLVITAELAGDYFTLRQLDTEIGNSEPHRGDASEGFATGGFPPQRRRSLRGSTLPKKRRS